MAVVVYIYRLFFVVYKLITEVVVAAASTDADLHRTEASSHGATVPCGHGKYSFQTNNGLIPQTGI